MFIYLMIYALLAVDLTWFNSCWSTPSPKITKSHQFFRQSFISKENHAKSQIPGRSRPKLPNHPQKITFPFLSEKKTPVNCPTPWQFTSKAPSQLPDLRGRGIWWPKWDGSPSATPRHMAWANGELTRDETPLKHGVKSPHGKFTSPSNGDFNNVWNFRRHFLFNGMELGYDSEIAGNMTKKKRIFVFYWNIMGIVYEWDVTMVSCKKWNVLFQEVNFGGVSSIISRCLRYLRHLLGVAILNSMVHHGLSSAFLLKMVILGWSCQHTYLDHLVVRTFSKPG